MENRLTNLLRAQGNTPSSPVDFEEVYQECHRGNLPLGETLVARGLVSSEGLRCALRQHTAEAIARLEEAVAVIRALWTGGPVTRPSPFYPLEEAYAHPVPDPVPRIIVGGETPNGARLAARVGDGWNTFDDNFERNLPLYLETLEAVGRRREDQTVLVGFQGDWLGDEDFRDSPWFHDPRGTWERWRAAGADGALVLARTTDDIDALVEAVDRW